MKSNKEKIRDLAMRMLKESFAEAQKNVDKALASGAIDTENWDENSNPMLVPKAIVIAVLEEEASAHHAVGTSFDKQVKKDTKNIRLFL